MKAYLVMVTENCTSFRGEGITRVYRAFSDRQRANDCVKNITLKDIWGDPNLPWPEDRIEITYDHVVEYCKNDFSATIALWKHLQDDFRYVLSRGIYFKVANFDKEYWCHCEIEDVEIE